MLGLPSFPFGVSSLRLLGTRDLRGHTRLPAPHPLFQLGPQSSNGEHLVSELTALVTGRRAESGREVNQTYRTVRGVLMLSARPPGSEGLDSTLCEKFVVAVGNYEVGWLYVVHRPVLFFVRVLDRRVPDSRFPANNP